MCSGLPMGGDRRMTGVDSALESRNYLLVCASTPTGNAAS